MTTKDKCKRSNLSILKQGAITELPFLKFKLPATLSPACNGLSWVLSKAYGGTLHKAKFYQALNQICLCVEVQYFHTTKTDVKLGRILAKQLPKRGKKVWDPLCGCLYACYLRKISSSLTKHLCFIGVLLLTQFYDTTNQSTGRSSTFLKVTDWFGGSVSSLDISMAPTVR